MIKYDFHYHFSDVLLPILEDMKSSNFIDAKASNRLLDRSHEVSWIMEALIKYKVYDLDFLKEEPVCETKFLFPRHVCLLRYLFRQIGFVLEGLDEGDINDMVNNDEKNFRAQWWWNIPYTDEGYVLEAAMRARYFQQDDLVFVRRYFGDMANDLARSADNPTIELAREMIIKHRSFEFIKNELEKSLDRVKEEVARR